LLEQNFHWEIWGSDSGVCEDSCLLGHWHSNIPEELILQLFHSFHWQITNSFTCMWLQETGACLTEYLEGRN
jgi:hypothetical protein